MEFYLETYLEEFLLTNWHLIDWGRPLRIWRGPNGESGHQLSTPVGRLDFLCVDDSSGALVAVELKRGRSSDRVVGQITRYMGWVRNEMARPEQPVEGLIVTHESDDRLHYSVSVVPSLGLLLYELTFALRSVGVAPTSR
jgi:restriction system protein